MTKLSVNLNKIALLRNQRDIGIPSVTQAADTCVAAGAHGITVHPRPDERHIRYSDVYELKEILPVEFNIEGNPFPRFMGLVREIKPEQCTLVPDSPDQNTSDHGWNLPQDTQSLRPIIEELKDLGIRVSLFVDAVPETVGSAKEIGADRIELYTEPYASAFANDHPKTVLDRFKATAIAAQEAGLGVNAGHDLNLKNLGPFLKAVTGVLEVSIGHALIAESLWMGLERTVKEYLKVLSQVEEG